MRAVDIGICHDDDLMVTELGDVEILSDAGAQARDDRLQFVVADHLIEARLFDIEHLAPER